MRTVIIAEAGVNHNGKINLALKLVDYAAKAKVDYVKFQTYLADELVQKNLKLAKYQRKNFGKKISAYKMLKKFELSKLDHKKIIERCDKRNIRFLSSPFDIKSIEFLNQLKLKTFKIPSGEITNIPYLRKIGSLKKKIILSTGMSKIEEIDKALKILIKCGTKKKDTTLLHCSTEYPANPNNLNLLSINFLRKRFKVKVGYSDHSLGIQASLTAVALGAKVIEKHFTLNKKLQGPDHMASITPNELNKLVRNIRNVEKILGKDMKKPYDKELENLKFARKFIVTRVKINKGEKFSENNITTKRSGKGIPAEKWDFVLGKVSKQNFLPDENVKI